MTWSTAAGLVVALLWAGGAAADVDLEKLRPGLLTTYRDATGNTVVRLEPTLALALKAGEAPHPCLEARDGTIQWQGYVNVLRAGPYRFSARLRGKFRLSVAGKEMLAAEVSEETPLLKEGPAVRLEAGVQLLTAEFIRLPGVARLEMFWQSPHFHKEPLPYDHCFHLPAQVPVQLAEDDRIERGRFLAEEHSCTACHQPGDSDRMATGLQPRKGPDLSRVGERVFAGWIYQWLADPQKLQPGAAMPRLFRPDDVGASERYAVAIYLASLGGPLRDEAKVTAEAARQRQKEQRTGQRLFTTTGCVACHRPQAEKPGAAATFALPALGSKTTPERLAAYLRDPLAVDPSGRMPQMLLQGDEARDLARYLCQTKDASPVDLPVPPAARAQLLDLGKRLVVERGCTNCHTIAPGGKPLASVPARRSYHEVAVPQRLEHGCLAKEAKAPAPFFGFTEPATQALRAFLRRGQAGAGSPSASYTARVTLQRYNCLACHSRDGSSGLSPELVEELRRFEKAENAEAISPPPLTGAGHKLRTPWLRQVMLQAGRARPWMGLRMPQFGAANIGHLPEALAALEGADPDDQVHQATLTTARLETGRHLVGKNAFGCISCHDIAGVPNHGTRGPDLALMNQRVRYEWYRRWLEQPQRMQPGTRMPMVFPDGKSTLPTVLGGKADDQADAMWAYLSLGMTMPLPEGLEPPKGLILTVKDRPVLLRTFMPQTGARAIAVGYPGEVSVAFDAATCRLTYAWSGNFLDASPVWNNRGGTPAKVLGNRFWTAPRGGPWAVTETLQPPDFVALAADPAYGAALPEGRVYDGHRQVRFEGYRTDKAGLPTFRYRLEAETAHSVTVTERPQPLRHLAGVGVARQFTLDLPAHRWAWLWAGESDQPPRLLDRKGQLVSLDLTNGKAEIAATERLLVLPQKSERVLLLGVTTAPRGARWHLQGEKSGWQVILLVPATAEASHAELGLRIWAPYRDDPEFLKELVASK